MTKKVFSIGSSLSKGLTDSINALDHYAGNLRVEVISLRNIELDPENPRELLLDLNDLYKGVSKSDKEYKRKINEKERLQTLADSIKEQGVINPILIYKHEKNYRVVTGERRVLATAMLKSSDIPARILNEKPDPLRLKLLQWIENIERSDLTLWEKVQNVQQIVIAYAKKKDKTVNEIQTTELSHLIGCSLAHATNYRTIISASDKVKSLIQKNDIRNLDKAVLIEKSPNNIQDQLISACLDNANLKKLKTIAIAYKNRKNSKELKKTDKRGRKSIQVNLGMTKNSSAVKVLIEIVHQSEQFQEHFSDFIAPDWRDYKAVTETFKEMLKKVEEIVLLKGL